MDHCQAELRIAEYEAKPAQLATDPAGHPTVGIGFNLDRDGAQPDSARYGQVVIPAQKDAQMIKTGEWA
jgi:hypothetical protein